MKLNQLGLGLVALALLGFAGWRFLGSKSEVKMPEKFSGPGICLSCKTEATIDYPAKSLPPYKCPTCDQEAFYMWWYCSECQHRFIPELTKETPRRPVRFPQCTHCSCKAVSGWIPEIMPARGDAKMPKP